MKTIEYRATFADGHHVNVTVRAMTINGGLAKALATLIDTHGLSNNVELNKIEFWQVT